jgi:hypothetical protein
MVSHSPFGKNLILAGECTRKLTRLGYAAGREAKP